MRELGCRRCGSSEAVACRYDAQPFSILTIMSLSFLLILAFSTAVKDLHSTPWGRKLKRFTWSTTKEFFLDSRVEERPHFERKLTAMARSKALELLIQDLLSIIERTERRGEKIKNLGQFRSVLIDELEKLSREITEKEQNFAMLYGNASRGNSMVETVDSRGNRRRVHVADFVSSRELFALSFFEPGIVFGSGYEIFLMVLEAMHSEPRVAAVKEVPELLSPISERLAFLADLIWNAGWSTSLPTIWAAGRNDVLVRCGWRRCAERDVAVYLPSGITELAIVVKILSVTNFFYYGMRLMMAEHVRRIGKKTGFDSRIEGREGSMLLEQLMDFFWTREFPNLEEVATSKGLFSLVLVDTTPILRRKFYAAITIMYASLLYEIAVHIFPKARKIMHKICSLFPA